MRVFLGNNPECLFGVQQRLESGIRGRVAKGELRQRQKLMR